MKKKTLLLASLALLAPIPFVAAQTDDNLRDPTDGPVVPAGPIDDPGPPPGEAVADDTMPQPPGPTPPATNPGDRPDIFAILNDAANYSTLASLLEASGLHTTLQGEGPFTIFAPSNRAFAKLGQERLDALQRPENAEELRALLAYHVVPGRIMMEDVEAGPVSTVHGPQLQIALVSGTPTVNEVALDRTDIAAGNGVVHSIDSVLVPDDLDEVDGEPAVIVEEARELREDLEAVQEVEVESPEP